MSQVCNVTMKVWQRKDGRWSGEARLKGPSKRNTKISHCGCVSQQDVENRVNGDVNELINGMGWERHDQPVEVQ